jgi:hypothetical protein
LVRQRALSYRQEKRRKRERVDDGRGKKDGSLPPPLQFQNADAFLVLRSVLSPLSLLEFSLDTRARTPPKNGRERQRADRTASPAKKRTHLVDELEEASSRLLFRFTKTAAPTAAPATAAVPTILALLDLREAFEEDLVIFHRAGATIAVPTRRETAGGSGCVRDLQKVFRRPEGSAPMSGEDQQALDTRERRVKALSFLDERARRVCTVSLRGG